MNVARGDEDKRGSLPLTRGTSPRKRQSHMVTGVMERVRESNGEISPIFRPVHGVYIKEKVRDNRR